jgi:hypothetical protein
MVSTAKNHHSLVSQDQLFGVKRLRIAQQLHLAHGPLRPDLLLHPAPRVLLDRLDQHAERRGDRAVVRDVRLVSPVVQLLDARRVAPAPQHPVAPRRDPPLLRRVVLVAVEVVFVRRRKGDGPLCEVAQADVRLHLLHELVVDQEVLERVLMDGRHDRVSALIDSVVQIPAHLYSTWKWGEY